MHPKGPTTKIIWPRRDDIRWVTTENIISESTKDQYYEGFYVLAEGLDLISMFYFYIISSLNKIRALNIRFTISKMFPKSFEIKKID